jgi:hypothetical protein
MNVGSEADDRRNTVLKAVHASLLQLTEQDWELLSLSAHELSVVHRFGVYLEALLADLLKEARLSIDMDYDRHGRGRKRLPPRLDREGESCFRPDLIVHQRMNDEHNLLVVEWKKMASAETLDLLLKRILRLTEASVQDGYGYTLGVIVDSDRDSLRWAYVTDRRTLSEWIEIDKRTSETLES